jgi:hypothetical protein
VRDSTMIAKWTHVTLWYYCHMSQSWAGFQYWWLSWSRWYLNMNNKWVYVENNIDATKGAIYMR